MGITMMLSVVVMACRIRKVEQLAEVTMFLIVWSWEEYSRTSGLMPAL